MRVRCTIVGACVLGLVVLAVTATARMTTTELAGKLCYVEGGGRFVDIPGFPGEMIDRRLLRDINLLERRKVTRLANWAEPRQNDPRSPFRWVGYNGDKNHGRGDHLHLSWSHSATKPKRPADWIYTMQCPRKSDFRARGLASGAPRPAPAVPERDGASAP